MAEIKKKKKKRCTMGQTPNGGFTPADLFLMSGVGKLKKAQVKDNDSITAEQINC